jgi:O-antigen ligase
VSTIERESATPLAQDWITDRLVNWALYGLVGIYLVAIIVAHATNAVAAWQLALFSVFLGTVLGCRLAVDSYRNTEHLQAAVLSILGFSFIILGIVYQSNSPGLGLGPNRPLAIIVVFLLTVTFLLVVTDARQYTRVEWGAIGCFAVFSGIYLAHTLSFDPSSSQSRWPVWAAVVMGVNLFVVPRLVPERVLLWFLARLAAITVLLGLVTYTAGEYTLWIFEINQFDSSPSVPGIDTDVTTLQSIFPNPNSFGLLAFAGFVASVVEFHRRAVARRPIGASLAIVLAGVCGLGVFLSNARAAMLASAVAAAIYGVYVVGGRLTVPPMAVVSVVGVLGLVVAMYSDVVDISSSGRFELWRASLGAIRDGPWLVGYGSGPAAPIIEPYLPDGASGSPHNAYLEVVLQTGVLGGIAYVGLVAGSIVNGLINYRNVNVAVLALAIGWAVHQGFESYTMFRWSLGPALATLAFGYLVVRTEQR